MKIQIACKKFCGIFWITERCTTISRLHMLKVWRKNFEISVKLSFSATSLFTRAMWGGRSCSSAVVPLVGSCFALQQSWIIFSVPSHCYILFHFTLNLATFITLYCTADTNFTPGSENNSIHSTLKVHIYNFVSWTHSLEKFLPWTFSHLLFIILHLYHQSFPWQSIPTASVILSWGIYYTFASNSTCQWFWLGALRMWCGGFIAGHVPAWGALVAL